MREAKTEYEGQLIRDFKKNPKPFHRYMRLKQSTKSTVRHLQKADGDMTTDDIETSNLLLEFFSSVFTKEELVLHPTYLREKLHIAWQMS